MALQTSGAISLLNLQNEFGGSNPISISEYYRGGGLVPSTRTTFVTTYEPGPGSSNFAAASLSSPLNGWAQRQDSPYTVRIFWNSDTQLVEFSGTSLGSPSSYTTGGWTYYRSATATFTNIPFAGANYYVWSIRRQQTSSTVVNINTSVPTSGQISLSNFYGATAT